MSNGRTRDLSRSRFVLLTTFRSTGQPVPTPVWVVQDRDHLAVLTNLNSAKVRRLRRDSSITLVPCSPQGKPIPLTPPVRGRANVITDPQTVQRVWRLVRRKYALEHAVLRVLGLLRPAWRRWTGPQAVLHLDLPPPPMSTATDLCSPTASKPQCQEPRQSAGRRAKNRDASGDGEPIRAPEGRSNPDDTSPARQE